MHETHCAPPSEVPFMYLHCWKVREGTPFFGAKGRIIDRPSPLFVRSLAQMVITYLPQSGVVRRW